MQDVIIVCAGSYGREIYWTLSRLNAEAQKQGMDMPYNILGYINDYPSTLANYKIDAPILGSIQDWYPRGDEMYALGTGKPEDKKKLVELLKPRGVRFMNVIGSKNTCIYPDLIMGEGCYISNNTYIAPGVKLGNYVNVNGSMLYSGAGIGDFSTTTGFAVIEEAIVGRGVYIGSKAVITKGCTVGDWARISAGSVVLEDVRPGATVFGMPAREIV